MRYVLLLVSVSAVLTVASPRSADAACDFSSLNTTLTPAGVGVDHTAIQCTMPAMIDVMVANTTTWVPGPFKIATFVWSGPSPTTTILVSFGGGQLRYGQGVIFSLGPGGSQGMRLTFESSGDYTLTLISSDGQSIDIPVRVSTGLSGPTNLQVAQIGTTGTGIQLAWTYGSDTIDGFKIYRKAASDTQWPSSPITSIQPGTAPYGFQDAVPTPYGTYSYRITAYQGTQESPASNVETCFQIQVGTSLNNTAMKA